MRIIMQAMQILQKLKAEYGINPTQVAKRTGITQSTVQRIYTGQTKDCRSSNYHKIKDLYEQTKTPSSN